MSAKKEARIPLAVGARVWLFASGDTAQRLSVKEETTRSWVLSDGAKVPKSCATDIYEVRGWNCLLRYCLTRDAADRILMERSRHRVSAAIRDGATPTDVLKQIATLLGLPSGVED